MDESSQFFDWVFVVLMFIVALAISIDWWIGKEGRKRMKGRIGDWWLHIDDLSYAGLTSEDASKVQRFLKRIFGDKIWSLTFFFRSALASVLSTIILIAVCYGINWLIYARSIFLFSLGTDENIWQWIVNRSVGFLLPNMLLDWLSLALTIEILSWMKRSIKWSNLVPLIALDIILALVMIMSTWLVGVSTYQAVEIRNSASGDAIREAALDFNVMLRETIIQTFNHRFREVGSDAYVSICRRSDDTEIIGGESEENDYEDKYDDPESYPHSPSGRRYCFVDFESDSELLNIISNTISFVKIGIEIIIHESNGLSVIRLLAPSGFIFWIIAITSSIPTLMHLCFLLITAVSKLFQPIFKPLSSRILFLFYESDRGVLSQFAIIISGVLKFIQEIAKRLL
jgi:hypothetical protein